MQFTALKPGIPKHLPKDKSFLSTVASSKDQTSARRLPDNGAAFRHRRITLTLIRPTVLTIPLDYTTTATDEMTASLTAS
jgi:hypothetical protein